MADFKPPVPRSMDSYLDEITRGRVARLTNVYNIDIDGALALIKQRPSASERMALLAALAARLNKYGEAKGYIELVPKSENPDHVAAFIVEDMLGLSGDSIEEKARSELLGIVKEFVKEGLNSRGKKGFEFLEVIWKLMNCTSAGEASRVLAAAGHGKLTDWLGKNYLVLAKTAMKKVGARRAVRNRIIRVLALKTVMLKAVPRLVARLNFVVTALELMLTPSEIASDLEEQRMAFYSIYGKVVSDQGSIFADLMPANQSRGGMEPILKYPMGHALQTAISTSH